MSHQFVSKSLLCKWQLQDFYFCFAFIKERKKKLLIKISLRFTRKCIPRNSVKCTVLLGLVLNGTIWVFNLFILCPSCSKIKSECWKIMTASKGKSLQTELRHSQRRTDLWLPMKEMHQLKGTLLLTSSKMKCDFPALEVLSHSAIGGWSSTW